MHVNLGPLYKHNNNRIAKIDGGKTHKGLESSIMKFSSSLCVLLCICQGGGGQGKMMLFSSPERKISLTKVS